LSRATEQGGSLGSVEIKPGALIVIAPYVLHRHRALWEQPDGFDPARFVPERRTAMARYTCLPFGAGPRTCIGSSFALQEATLILAVLVQLRHASRAGDQGLASTEDHAAASARPADGDHAAVRCLRGHCATWPIVRSCAGIIDLVAADHAALRRMIFSTRRPMPMAGAMMPDEFR